MDVELQPSRVNVRVGWHCILTLGNCMLTGGCIGVALRMGVVEFCGVLIAQVVGAVDCSARVFGVITFVGKGNGEVRWWDVQLVLSVRFGN